VPEDIDDDYDGARIFSSVNSGHGDQVMNVDQWHTRTRRGRVLVLARRDVLRGLEVLRMTQHQQNQGALWAMWVLWAEGPSPVWLCTEPTDCPRFC
jgi:hypothetical protein